MADSNSFGCGGLIALVLAVGYCSQVNRSAKTASVSSATRPTDDTTIRGGETYDQFDNRRDALNTSLYSGQYGCTGDCSGHEAGRQWAEDNDINDPDECGGKSWSFEEGCREYAEEQADDGEDRASDDD
jgi:hypothetical protein